MAGEQKKAFIIELIRNAQELAPIMGRLGDQKKEYLDNGYQAGGSNEILDADLQSHDMTVTEFNNYVSMLQELINFFGNSAVTQGDYSSVINRMRRSPGI